MRRPPSGTGGTGDLAAHVRLGPAEILTVIDGERVESFEVEIIKVNAQKPPR